MAAMSFVVLSLGLTVRPPLSSLAISSRHRLSTLTAAVPSTAAPSTAGFASNREALAAAPLFPRTWVPLASVFELNPDRPTPLRFLDQRYIAYCDNKGEWVVMDDACPHRLAPLSEGRIDREADRIECAYHGWAFESSGACVAIPQASDAVAKASLASPRACVASYPVVVEKSVLWTWPWPEDPLTVVGEPMAHPETMLAGVADDASTYTRDLPYGWDTLLENIVDPSHIPFAHHGLQGKRSDAIPINMSVPTNRADDGSKFGFAFDFGDRTMGKRRAGVGEFRAPFVVAYNADFENSSRTFNLTVVCVPTAPGWSRAIIYGGPQPQAKKPKGRLNAHRAEERSTEPIVAPAPVDEPQVAAPPAKKTSLVGKIFRLLPVWVVHLGSNRFLDSDLAFLHYQEQSVRMRKAPTAVSSYFMPAPADRCIAALRKWLAEHAHVLGPLPPPINTRPVLFDRWSQHTSHCVHCQAAVDAIARWRRRAYIGFGLSLVAGIHLWPGRVLSVACLGLLRVLAIVEQQFKYSDYKHYKNH